MNVLLNAVWTPSPNEIVVAKLVVDGSPVQNSGPFGIEARFTLSEIWICPLARRRAATRNDGRSVPGVT